MAWGLQGLSVTHGLTHLRLLQARDGGQSLSEEHPISRGGSKKIKVENLKKLFIERGYLTNQVTSFITLARISRVAGTNHYPPWQLILHSAICISHTWPQVDTWVEALAREASMLRWTITICHTSRFFNDWFRDWGKITYVTSNQNIQLLYDLLGVQAIPYGSPV